MLDIKTIIYLTMISVTKPSVLIDSSLGQ